MKSIALAMAILLTACGGGGGGAAPQPVPDAEVSLTATAPNDNLLAASATLATKVTSTVCGFATGTKSLNGTVHSVHDGDTITVNSQNIRLDSIDAPELAQTYGAQARQTLANLVLGKNVTVTYSKVDKYGRIVGSVFTDTCIYANLNQVANGAAWYYKAYQCEIAATTRNSFEAAQADAQGKDLGLWSQPATPPWVYRNGVDAQVPTCNSNSPSWEGNPAPIVTPSIAPSPAPTVTPIAPSTPLTCFKVWVNGYYRSNGTYVSGYYRNSPGC